MENNRAMQAALELSMLNLNNTSYSMSSPEPPYGLLEDEIPIDSQKSKSQNITQCVSVPSSEHVAEIVGRQGGFELAGRVWLCILFANQLLVKLSDFEGLLCILTDLKYIFS